MKRKLNTSPGANKKVWMLEKLERLIKMCRATEPDKPDDRELFTEDNIKAHDLHRAVEEGYDMMGASDVRDIMREANRIWKVRKMIWNGDADTLKDAKLQQDIEDFLKQNQKINAIKYYRNSLRTGPDSAPSLKESKQYVDKIQEEMIAAGKLSPS